MSEGTIARWRGGWAALAVTSVARALVSTAVSLLLVALIPTALGWTPTVVLTPSMEPRIHVGDLVVSRPAHPQDLQLGQVLLVDDPDWPGRLRLHRFVKVAGDARLVLRGDANDHSDSSSVSLQAVRGIASLRVPAIGLPTTWVRSGQIVPLAGAALLAALALAGCFLFRADPELVREEPRRPGRPSGPARLVARLTGSARRRRRAQAAVAAGTTLLLVAIAATPAFAVTFTSSTSNPGNSYATANRFSCGDRILGDSPIDYWKLSESSGTTATDQKGTRNGTYSASGVTYGVNAPCLGDGDKGVTLSGGSAVGVSTSTSVDPATLSSFSEEIWFKAGSGASGLLIGLRGDPTAVSGNNDRPLMMATTGQIVFGMFDGSIPGGVIVTSPSSYQDSTWHLATATYSSSAGMKLYIDGSVVGTHAALGQLYTAAVEYWRIGYGDVTFSGWNPSGAGTPALAFTGSLAQASAYSSALSATQVANHYGARTVSCSSTLGADSPYLYWKLADSTGTTAADFSSAGTHVGQYPLTGVTKGVTGPCALEGLTAVSFSGGDTTGVTPASPADSVTSPTAYTTEIWFKSTTSGGGMLVGLYGSQTAGTTDRLLYMDTNGKIAFGMYSSGSYYATSSSAYNDGSWHHAAASWSGATGMRLYVDGSQVATNSGPSTMGSVTGFWRVGYGDTSGWANTNTQSAFNGSVAGAAVYTSVLSGPRVAAHAAAR